MTSNTQQGIQVIGLGQACIDYLGRLGVYPQEDEKCELMDLHMQCGGPASGALVTLSRLGIRTSFLGSISDDPWGAEIVKGLREEKVDTTFLKITPGYTSQFAFIAISEKSGNRTIFWHRGTVPHLKPADIDLKPFSHAAILHLDSLMLEAGQEAARQAKKMGLKVVCDAGTMRHGFREMASLVDVLIASKPFAEGLAGKGVPLDKALEELRRLGPDEVIITRGSKGSIGLNEKGVIVQDAFSVQAVDSTGAGDVYHGAYVYGLLQGWGMGECMRFASATAALKCRKIGARQGIPRLQEVMALINP